MTDVDYSKSTTVNWTKFNVLEELEKNDYPQYRYLFFTLPLLLNAHIIVETGFALGHSTRIWLESLGNLSLPETRTLHTYEINCGAYENVRKDILENLQLANVSSKPKWIIHCEDSTKAVFADGKIDILYLDSDHSYATVHNELNQFTSYLSSHSVILTHDSWPAILESPHPSDTYRALKNWADALSWKVVLFTFPEGVTLLYRER